MNSLKMKAILLATFVALSIQFNIDRALCHIGIVRRLSASQFISMKSPVILKSSYHVKSLSRSIDFYTKCLGMKVLSEEKSSAALGYTEKAAIEIKEISATQTLSIGDVTHHIQHCLTIILKFDKNYVLIGVFGNWSTA